MKKIKNPILPSILGVLIVTLAYSSTRDLALNCAVDISIFQLVIYSVLIFIGLEIITYCVISWLWKGKINKTYWITNVIAASVIIFIVVGFAYLVLLGNALNCLTF